MKLLFISISIFLILSEISCQVPEQITKANFQYVVLPDSISTLIRKYYIEMENRDSIPGQVTVFNIKYPNDYQFKDGLFRFRISGPHFSSHYFIYKKNNIHIFYKKNAIGILEELKVFIESLDISELEKIELIELTALMLREEYEIENN